MRSFASIVLLLLLPLVAGAQWRQTNGPSETSASDLAVAGSTLYAATSVGLYGSTDKGSSWHRIDGPFNNLPVQTVCVDGSRIMVGTSYWSGGGIFLSEDGGASFRLVLSMPTTLIRKVGSVFYAAAGYNGLYRSIDSGATWSPTSNPLYNGSSVTTFLPYGSSVLASTDQIGVIGTTDNGRTWSMRGSANWSINDMIDDGGRLLAAVYHGVDVSTDGGGSWDRLSAVSGQGIQAKAIVARGSDLFCASDSAVFRSTDHGSTWRKVGTEFDAGAIVGRLIAVDGSIVAATARALYRLEEPADKWVDAGQGIISSGYLVRKIFASNGVILSGRGISTDGGESWTSLFDLLSGVNSVSGIVTTSRGNLVGTNLGLYLRSASGAWSRMTDALFGTDSVMSVTSSGEDVVAAFSRGVYISSDGGSTWRNTGGIGGIGTFYAIPVGAFHDDRYFYLSTGSNNASLYRMEIGDDAWVKVLIGYYNAMSEVNGTLVGLDGSQQIRRAEDRGETWPVVGLAPHPYNGTPLALVGTEGMIALACAGYGPAVTDVRDSAVWISVDRGSSWYAAGQGLPPGPGVFALAVSGGYLYASLPSGVWRRPLSELRAVAYVPLESMPGEAEGGFAPNPFLTSTTLRLTSELRSGELVLSNALGQQVEHRAGLSGSRVTLDRSDLPSGIYYCTVRDNGTVIWRGRLVAR